MKERLGTLRAEAKAADRENRLEDAIRGYKAVLAVDSGDNEANAFFETRKRDIAARFKAIHRKGIDQYVSGQITKAVEIWRQGSSLLKNSPAAGGDGIPDFDRDIQKAQKLLDLRGQK
jgi:hypothetical protein